MKLQRTTKHTNGTRHQVKIQKNTLSKYARLIKTFFIKKNTFAGRNNTGRITMRHQGGGCKYKKHFLEYSNNYFSILLKTNYNPASNSFINYNFDIVNKNFFKTLNIKGLHSGVLLESRARLTDIRLGFRSVLKNLPSGSIISSVGSDSSSKKIYAKSAGAFCQILEKRLQSLKIKLPSGKVIVVPNHFEGTLGCIDNIVNKLTVTGKAGRNRLKGIRPSVRGIAMNPVDHPHGGKSNKGMPQVTPWGIPTKNKPTVKKNNNYE